MADDEQACFYDQNFLAQQPLTADNIMEYFSRSQYYDKESVNEILKMQSQFAGIDISHKLTTVEGFFYILEYEAEGLFVIAKKENSQAGTRILKMYYCIHGYIYCAPTVKAVSECRLANALWYLSEALDMYEEQKKFSWVEGFQLREEQRKDKDGGKELKFAAEVLHEFERKAHGRD